MSIAAVAASASPRVAVLDCGDGEIHAANVLVASGFDVRVIASAVPEGRRRVFREESRTEKEHGLMHETFPRGYVRRLWITTALAMPMQCPIVAIIDAR